MPASRHRLPTPNSPPRIDRRRRTQQPAGQEDFAQALPSAAAAASRSRSRSFGARARAPPRKDLDVAYASPVSMNIASDMSDDECEQRSSERCVSSTSTCSPGSSLVLSASTFCSEPLSNQVLLPLAHLLLSSLFPPSNAHSLYPLSGFIKEMVTRSGTAPETLALGLLYLWRCRDRIARNRAIAQASPTAATVGGGAIPHPSLCARRMFLSALVVAWKFLSDRTYTNSAWSKISGLATSEINANERCLLGMLSWTLDVKPEEWSSWHAWIDSMRDEVARAAVSLDSSSGQPAAQQYARSDVDAEKMTFAIPARRSRESDEETLREVEGVY